MYILIFLQQLFLIINRKTSIKTIYLYYKQCCKIVTYPIKDNASGKEMKHARKMLLGANSTFFFLSTNQLLDLANAYFIFCLVAIKKKSKHDQQPWLHMTIIPSVFSSRISTSGSMFGFFTCTKSTMMEIAWTLNKQDQDNLRS